MRDNFGVGIFEAAWVISAAPGVLNAVGLELERDDHDAHAQLSFRGP
jgi:hypothetical protein